MEFSGIHLQLTEMRCRAQSRSATNPYGMMLHGQAVQAVESEREDISSVAAEANGIDCQPRVAAQRVSAPETHNSAPANPIHKQSGPRAYALSDNVRPRRFNLSWTAVTSGKTTICGAFFESLASAEVGRGSTHRTARCGPACPMVWQGRAGDRTLYADCVGIWLRRPDVQACLADDKIAKQSGAAACPR